MHTGLRNTPTNSHAISMLQLNKQPLPKQPVPDLNETAEQYLRSLEPLLNEKEYEKTEKIVLNFISDEGVGSKLHKRLLNRLENTDNWMSEWWLNTAYLGYRAPVIVNSSPGIVGPPINIKHPDDVYILAAQLVRAICDYKDIVKSGAMKQEMIRGVPLDMQPYAMILGSNRQPSEGSDVLLQTDEANHIIIIRNNHFFKLHTVDELGILSESKFVDAIKDIAERSYIEAKPVGILTGNDRNTWAEDYNLLLGLGNNRNIVKDIESSLFVLCLDKDIPKAVFKEENNASVRAIQCLTGFNSRTNAGNRWHDKTVQFIISSDGFIGMEYEHSPCEGTPIAVLYDYVLSHGKGTAEYASPKNFPQAEHLKFEINNTLERAIEKATYVVDKLSEDIDMECFTFDEFGTKAIKQIKLSPDSFIQIAMQVAFYKLHGKPPVHYEAASLRRFKSARTECIRSTSCESMDFAMAMVFNNSNINNEKKRELMVKAIQMHKRIANKAAIGKGVDRHLYGLKMIAENEGIELPELYKDIGYTKSTYFTLTSSQVPFKSASFMCYGPVVPEGYGCCYNPRLKDILFACSSFKSCNDTSSKRFANALKETLCDMKKLANA
ncbi:carnitine O-acetyltransferase-like isoform X2 [Andrena cerasifolii]|uniref:carnitine O-acetyltransferase-like isoform X2 n=1 Tax=Andrena cerasifolii TaxID=2819439 RepID=UPI00403835D1